METTKQHKEYIQHKEQQKVQFYGYLCCDGLRRKIAHEITSNIVTKNNGLRCLDGEWSLRSTSRTDQVQLATEGRHIELNSNSPIELKTEIIYMMLLTTINFMNGYRKVSNNTILVE